MSSPAAAQPHAIERMYRGLTTPCAQGHLDAAYQLGVMYLNGWGEKASRTQATYFWALAAKFGHVLAMYNLAMLHLAEP